MLIKNTVDPWEWSMDAHNRRMLVASWPFGLIALWFLVGGTYVALDPNADKPPFQYTSRSLFGPRLSDTLTHMQKLRDVPALRGPNDRHLDLAYRWKADGTGGWVGFARTGRKSHVTVEGAEFAAMLAAAGVHDLPAIPERPVDRSQWWLFLLVGLPCGAIFGLRRNRE
jgi:hypothetical protein